MNGDLAYEGLAGQIKAVAVSTVVQLTKTVPEIAGQMTAFEAHLTNFLFAEGPEWIEQDQEEEAKEEQQPKRRKAATAA